MMRRRPPGGEGATSAQTPRKGLLDRSLRSMCSATLVLAVLLLGSAALVAAGALGKRMGVGNGQRLRSYALAAGGGAQRSAQREARRNVRNFDAWTVRDRLDRLEKMAAARGSWLKDPHRFRRKMCTCNEVVWPHEATSAHVKRLDGDVICVDALKQRTDGKPCVVLDFGIRDEPEFGVFMLERFNCDVHGFDPSPITQAKNWLQRYGLEDNPKYTFHSYGVGAIDGYVELFDYDWEQISIHRAHDRIDPSDSLKLLPEPRTKVHRVKVRASFLCLLIVFLHFFCLLIVFLWCTA